MTASSAQVAEPKPSPFERVLICAPFGRDADLVADALRRADIAVMVCRRLEDLLQALRSGAGALLIADECLTAERVCELSAALKHQPAWSDLPVLVMTGGGAATIASEYRATLLQPLGNLTLLERPLRVITLLSAVRSALRARRRQYEISSHIAEKERLVYELADRERLYRGIGESIDFGIWVTARDGRNIYTSESFLRLVGMTQDRYTESGWIEAMHPEEVDSAVRGWKECVASGTLWNRTLRYRGADGLWHPVLSRGVPIHSETGDILYWAGINLDVSREKQTEVALLETNESLRRSNADLEQFAYASSHDLREPLRNVSIYSQLLAECCGPNLDGQARDFLSMIVASAGRMEMLIRDLLSYTRIDRIQQSEPAEVVDANIVLQKVLIDLDGAIRDSGAEITHGRLPSLRMHEVHLRQLFQNLIGNALKYRSDEAPRIKITVRQATQQKGWLFSIADNGIGIEPEFAEQIFGIFKRLHSASKYPGTGIGLAICQKIVERYGGKIWVEPNPDRGSTFRFTLPAA